MNIILIFNRQFNSILDALLYLHRDVVELPGDSTSTQIQNNSKFFPYFKDCLGALDESHIPCCVPENTTAAFRNRKGTMTQNISGVVSFDMTFAFVYAGWEGSAHDGQVLKDAFTKGISVLKG
jgi:hypothetical protein